MVICLNHKIDQCFRWTTRLHWERWRLPRPDVTSCSCIGFDATQKTCPKCGARQGLLFGLLGFGVYRRYHGKRCAVVGGHCSTARVASASCIDVLHSDRGRGMRDGEHAAISRQVSDEDEFEFQTLESEAHTFQFTPPSSGMQASGNDLNATSGSPAKRSRFKNMFFGSKEAKPDVRVQQSTSASTAQSSANPPRKRDMMKRLFFGGKAAGDAASQDSTVQQEEQHLTDFLNMQNSQRSERSAVQELEEELTFEKERAAELARHLKDAQSLLEKSQQKSHSSHDDLKSVTETASRLAEQLDALQIITKLNSVKQLGTKQSESRDLQAYLPTLSPSPRVVEMPCPSPFGMAPAPRRKRDRVMQCVFGRSVEEREAQQEQVQRLEHLLRLERERAGQLAKHLNDTQQWLQDAQKEARTSREDLRVATERTSRLTEQLDGSQAQRNKWQHQWHEQNRELENSRGRVSELENEVDRLQAERKRGEEACAYLRGEVQAERERGKKLQEQLACAQEERKREAGCMPEAAGSEADQARVRKMEMELERLQSERQRADQKCRDLEDEVRAERARGSKLQEELMSARQQREDQASQAAQADKRTKLSHLLADVQDERDALQKRCQDLESNCSFLQRRIDRLETEDLSKLRVQAQREKDRARQLENRLEAKRQDPYLEMRKALQRTVMDAPAAARQGVKKQLLLCFHPDRNPAADMANQMTRMLNDVVLD